VYGARNATHLQIQKHPRRDFRVALHFVRVVEFLSPSIPQCCTIVSHQAVPSSLLDDAINTSLAITNSSSSSVSGLKREGGHQATHSLQYLCSSSCLQATGAKREREREHERREGSGREEKTTTMTTSAAETLAARTTPVLGLQITLEAAGHWSRLGLHDDDLRHAARWRAVPAQLHANHRAGDGRHGPVAHDREGGIGQDRSPDVACVGWIFPRWTMRGHLAQAMGQLRAPRVSRPLV